MSGSEDTAHKTVFFHFNFYCRAFLHMPERILEADAKYYKKYVGGNNHDFMQEEDLRKWQRLDFLPPMRADFPSLISVMGPYTDTEKVLPVYSDLRGYYQADGPDVNSPAMRMLESNTTAHYASADYTNERWGFNGMRGQRYGARLLEAEPQRRCNSLCIRGYMRRWTKNGEFEDIQFDQGHHGPEVPSAETGPARNGNVALKRRHPVVMGRERV